MASFIAALERITVLRASLMVRPAICTDVSGVSASFNTCSSA